MQNKPKPAFYIAIFLVIAGLVGLGLWRCGGSKKKKGPDIDPALVKKPDAGVAPTAEAPGGDDSLTTLKDYTFVPSAVLPEVKGTSDYKALGANKTVKFAVNVWAGWAPIVFANEGHKAKKKWKAGDGTDFQVELTLIDNPVNMRDTFAAGEVQIGWATVDMLPLLLEGLSKDSRTMPRVYQQVDWSNGGDGIVVRDAIKTMSDLRGKKVVLAENSPSHFFLLYSLLSAGVQPSEVDMVFTQDAFQAAVAFNKDKSIAGCVSWAPDIYKLSKAKGNRMLVSTLDANKLIADVWFARADFARDNPAIIEGLVRGIFDAMESLKEDANKQKVAAWMADFYSLPEADTFGMLADAHPTNVAENREFLMNQNNPTNFEQTYTSAFNLYKAIGSVTKKVDFDEVLDFTVLQKLLKDEKYAKQRDEYQINFAPTSASTVQAESPEILTKTIVIQFASNDYDIEKKVEKDVGGKLVQELYDPKIPLVLKEVGKLAGTYGAARIVIEGHTDATMKGRTDEGLVKELAQNRANSVKQGLIRMFPTLQPNQFSVAGVGWDRPFDADDPLNHAKNRRVEIKVYPAESPN
jgi:NitT/TauT family transport system substrate-binding protein